MDIIRQHFPDISDEQLAKLSSYRELIAEWNDKINLISRSDIENLPKRHILHSLAIAKVAQFASGSSILDVGTGGGFPGIPLAILFPQSRFLLIDSIGKKIKVVQDCIERLGLENARAQQIRAENVDKQFDFIVARAVTQLPKFMGWIRKKVKRSQINEIANGILYLKGGDLTEEFADIPEKALVHPIRDHFEYEEFDEKYVIHIPIQ